MALQQQNQQQTLTTTTIAPGNDCPPEHDLGHDKTEEVKEEEDQLDQQQRRRQMVLGTMHSSLMTVLEKLDHVNRNTKRKQCKWWNENDNDGCKSIEVNNNNSNNSSNNNNNSNRTSSANYDDVVHRIVTLLQSENQTQSSLTELWNESYQISRQIVSSSTPVATASL